jgi:lipid-A-disaccharide synthase
VTGEASGDLHGAHLIRALKEEIPEVKIFGIGGPQMREAGLKTVYEAERLAVVGVTEVLYHLKHIWQAWQKAKGVFLKEDFDLFIPIDYPDFNLRLASVAKAKGVPVLYYISPQIWAWRENRVKKIAKLVDEMAVVLPFEEAFYRDHGIKARFVGHPLLDIMPSGQVEEEPLIGLLPGSRVGEIKRIGPIMLKAASFIYEKRPEFRFILPLATTIDKDWIEQFIFSYKPNFPLSIALDPDYALRQRCCFLVVASGTATLETAILLKPSVIVYCLSLCSYVLGKNLIKAPYIGLVNWVGEKKIIAEFIQYQAKPQAIAKEVLTLLANPKKIRQIKEELKTLRDRLGRPGVARRVAKIAKQMLKKKNGCL